MLNKRFKVDSHLNPKLVKTDYGEVGPDKGDVALGLGRLLWKHAMNREVDLNSKTFSIFISMSMSNFRENLETQ